MLFSVFRFFTKYVGRFFEFDKNDTIYTILFNAYKVHSVFFVPL